MDPLFCENCVKYLIDNSYPETTKGNKNAKRQFCESDKRFAIEVVSVKRAYTDIHPFWEDGIF